MRYLFFVAWTRQLQAGCRRSPDSRYNSQDRGLTATDNMAICLRGEDWTRVFEEIDFRDQKAVEVTTPLYSVGGVRYCVRYEKSDCRRMIEVPWKFATYA
ncbi:hypothetical protein C8R45DRAFT_1000029 [Mycena sanguinolenta]|nr:hypothetical protein C8R45DRAFT_1000029 [Mycena sanguinolenta]